MDKSPLTTSSTASFVASASTSATCLSPDLVALVEEVRAVRMGLDAAADSLVAKMESLHANVTELEKAKAERERLRIAATIDCPGSPSLLSESGSPVVPTFQTSVRTIATLIAIVATSPPRPKQLDTTQWQAKLARLPAGRTTQIVDVLVTSMAQLGIADQGVPTPGL